MFYLSARRLAGRPRTIFALATILLTITILISTVASDSPTLGRAQQNATFFDKLRNTIRPAASTEQPPTITTTITPSSSLTKGELANATDDEAAELQADEEDFEDDDDLDGEDEEDEEEEAGDEKLQSASGKELATRPPDTPKVYDILGNQFKIEGNRTVIVLQNKARDLGLLTIKAILLGPLIGLTLKAALIRGLLWAVGAYFMHLFFPSLLGTLGLGTGLVGFARSGQAPDYSQMLIRAALNYLETR